MIEGVLCGFIPPLPGWQSREINWRYLHHLSGSRTVCTPKGDGQLYYFSVVLGASFVNLSSPCLKQGTISTGKLNKPSVGGVSCLGRDRERDRADQKSFPSMSFLPQSRKAPIIQGCHNSNWPRFATSLMARPIAIFEVKVVGLVALGGFLPSPGECGAA